MSFLFQLGKIKLDHLPIFEPLPWLPGYTKETPLILSSALSFLRPPQVCIALQTNLLLKQPQSNLDLEEGDTKCSKEVATVIQTAISITCQCDIQIPSLFLHKVWRQQQSRTLGATHSFLTSPKDWFLFVLPFTHFRFHTTAQAETNLLKPLQELRNVPR